MDISFYHLKIRQNKQVTNDIVQQTVEIKHYNVMTDGQKSFDQPVRNNLRTYDGIQKIATGKGDDYTTGCLLDYNYLNDYYKMMAIDVSKLQALDADPKAIQQINFTGNLNREEGAPIFFIIKEAKGTILVFSRGIVRVL